MNPLIPVCTPQHDANPRARRDAVDAQRARYEYTWDRPEGVATLRELPSEQRYSPRLVADFLGVKESLAAQRVKTTAGRDLDAARDAWEGDVGAAGPFGVVKRAADSLRAPALAAEGRRGTPSVCAEYFDGELPPLARRFVDDPSARDALHAWQRVAGANPMMIRRARAMPDALAVTRAHAARALGDADTLDAALAEGRVYVGDWTALDGVVAGSGRGAPKWLVAPWAVYVESREGALGPVAIQCGARPGSAVVTPDEGPRWEAAKLAVQCADAQVQGLHWHLGRCHFVMEVFALATMRQLADAHPLKALLRPHLEYTLAINRSVRDELMVPGTDLETLMAPTLARSIDLVARALATFDYATALPEADLAARDVNDLARYPWRDDGRDVWRAIRSFVDGYLRLYYPDDDSVRADPELAAWGDDLSGRWAGRLSVPSPKTFAALADLAAYVVWVAGPQHSVINYGQHANLSLAAMSPTALYADVPGLGATRDHLEAMYPPEPLARAQYDFFYAQSQLQENALGQYPAGAFVDPRVADPLRAFQRELAELEARFVARDATRLTPFPWLRPSAIRASIHS